MYPNTLRKGASTLLLVMAHRMMGSKSEPASQLSLGSTM